MIKIRVVPYTGHQINFHRNTHMARITLTPDQCRNGAIVGGLLVPLAVVAVPSFFQNYSLIELGLLWIGLSFAVWGLLSIFEGVPKPPRKQTDNAIEELLAFAIVRNDGRIKSVIWQIVDQYEEAMKCFGTDPAYAQHAAQLRLLFPSQIRDMLAMYDRIPESLHLRPFSRSNGEAATPREIVHDRLEEVRKTISALMEAYTQALLHSAEKREEIIHDSMKFLTNLESLLALPLASNTSESVQATPEVAAAPQLTVSSPLFAIPPKTPTPAEVLAPAASQPHKNPRSFAVDNSQKQQKPDQNRLRTPLPDDTLSQVEESTHFRDLDRDPPPRDQCGHSRSSEPQPSGNSSNYSCPGTSDSSPPSNYD